MPIRNYDSLDVINYVPTFVPGGNITPTVTDTNFGTVTISGSGISVVDPNSLNFSFSQAGELTFSNIPDDAVIFTVIITIRWLYNVSITAVNAGPELITLGHGVDMIFPYTPPDPIDPDAVIISFSTTENGFTSINYFRADSGVHHFTVNYPNGISKTTLIADHGILGNVISTQLSRTIDPPGVGSSTITGLFKYSNFNLSVQYNEGPIVFDLVDNGASVVVGQESIIKAKDGESAEDITEVLVSIGTKDGETVYTPATIKERTPGRVIFIVPNTQYPPEGKEPELEEPPIADPKIVAIKGKTFTGTIIIGAFTILYSESSGIYELISGKINDTLYLHNTGLTDDFAIPEPFIKTGFIDG